MDTDHVKQEAEAVAKVITDTVKNELSKPAWGKYILYAVLAIGVIVAIILAAKAFWPKPATTTNTYQAAPAAPGMANMPTHDIAITKIKVYDKQLAAKKMDLPADITNDPKKELLNTSKIPASEGGYVTATVLNTETGATQTVIKEVPRPWFVFGGRTAIGARVGLSAPNGTTGTLYFSQDVVRVGKVYLAGYAEANASQLRGPEAKAMVDVSIRWE